MIGVNYTGDYGLARMGVAFEPISMTTLAMLGLGATAAGTAVSAYGTIAGGKAKEAAGIAEAQAQTVGSEMVAGGAEAEAAFSAATQRKGSEMIAAAQEKGGVLNQQAAEFQAQQADQAGRESLGVAQRSALDRREQIKLTLADLQAKAAASGGGASDPTIKAIARKIAERGEYEALGMMYAGESQKAGYEDVAKGLRFTGDAQRYGADQSALATRFSGETGAQAAELKGKNVAAAARFGGYAAAQAAVTGGAAAASTANYGAFGTILGGTGKAFTQYAGIMNPNRPNVGY
jgi:hypothetical protein